MMSAMSNIAGFVGVLIMFVLGLILCIKEKQGILIANQIIIPLIFIFLICLLLQGFSFASQNEVGVLGVFGVFGVFYYIALNELISLGSLLVVLHKANKKELLISALIGCFILSFMIVAVIVILNNYQFTQIHMPLKDVAFISGGLLPIFTDLILFCTIFTTFLSSAFGIYKKVKSAYKRPTLTFIIILLCCYLLSFVGFTNLVQYAYNVVGFVSLGVTLCFMLVK